MSKKEQSEGWDREGLVRRLHKVLDLQEQYGPMKPEDRAKVLKVLARIAKGRAGERYRRR